MVLQKQAVTINLSTGLDTKTDSKHVIPGKMTRLENCVFRKGMSLEKRRGFDEIKNLDINSNALGVGSALANFKDELLQYNNQLLYGYSQNAGKWISKGTSFTSLIESKQIVKNTATQTQADSAALNGVGVYGWEDSRGGVRGSVLDETTGSVLLSDVLIDANGERVKCLAFGLYLYVFYVTTSQELKVSRVNPESPGSFETPVLISSSLDATYPNYDVINYEDERILIFLNEATAITIQSIWLDQDLNVLAGIFPPRTYTPHSFDQCVAIVPANNQIYILYRDFTSAALRFILLDSAARIVDTGATIEVITNVNNVTGIANDANDGILVFYEVPGATPDVTIIKTCEIVGTTVGTLSVFMRSVGLWTRAFEYTDANNIRNIFMGVTHESDLQSTFFVIRSDGLIVGKQQYTNGSGLTSKPFLATVNQTGNQFSYTILKKNQIISENATIFTPTGVMRTTLDFTNSDTFISREVGNNLLIVGGVLNMYDGDSIVEHGFLLYPERVTAVANGSGGSLDVGDYLIYIVYEWTDNFGQIHRSRPSVATSVSAVANDSIDVTAPTLRLTRKDGTNRSNVSIVGYVTEANGSIAYRFTSITTPILNDTTVDTVSLGTITSVSTTSEILYTVGNVLPNDPAPACSVIEVFQNRAWLGGLENPSQVWFSKENKLGLPVEFSDEFQKAIETANGPVTSLSFVDDKLLAFKADRYFITYGDGPNDTNTLGGFSEFEDRSVDIGCENPRSITFLPNGIMLKTKKGFYSIDSALTAQYIGADVEEFNGLTVTSANLLPDLNECRFTTNDGALLIYNYYYGKWSTATNLKANSAVLWQNALTILKTNGTIFNYNDAIFKDATAGYGVVLESGWISMGNISSYKRVYELLFFGNYKSQHKIRVKIAYNNDDSWLHSGVYDPTTSFPVEYYGDDSPYGETNTVYGGKPIDYCVRVRLKKQKCSSFKFRFEELTTSATVGTHEAMTISDLGILVGLKKGAVKKPQSRNLKMS